LRRRRLERVSTQLVSRLLDDPVPAESNGAATAAAIVRRTQAILEGIADGVYVTGAAHGEITLWNPGAERLIGCPARKAIGKTCGDVLKLSVRGKPIDCTAGCALLRSHRDANTAEVEAERIQPGGAMQRVVVSACRIDDAEGNPVEVVHSVRDVTAIKNAQEAKTMFLATASHELKTPLTVILGYTQGILDGWIPADQQESALTTIDSRAKELSKIVDRLLMTGRIESGRVALDLAVVSLRELIPERVESLAVANGRTVTVSLPEEMPAVIGDADAITTVTDHLLDNAIKYSPDGGDISVDVTYDDRDAHIAVIDHGIGMTAEGIAHCFDYFWQAEASDRRRFGGTGVGLYIVRSLVESMGGKVGVRSDPRDGTVFTIQLRRATDDAVQPPSTSAEPGVGRRTMIHEFMRQIGVPEAYQEGAAT
jgi:two-component system, OmpR family, phosphate regulon sensor histidine kinase PhoR